MPAVTAIFCDVGGVLLTNGWDHEARRAAALHFGLDRDDLEQRHADALADFETGRASLDDYLERTVFHCERPFSRDALREFVLARSQPLEDALAVMRRLAAGPRLVASLNNESRDLNEYRIRRYGLRECFSLFLSSCYLGARKPDEAIYRRALGITQRDPSECLFIDDREENLVPARRLGMRTLAYQGPKRLEEDLRTAGVWPDSP